MAYIINANIPFLSKIELNDIKSRHPIGLYNAKYFDEPFAALVTTRDEHVKEFHIASTEEDRKLHYDFSLTFNNGDVYYVDTKTVSYIGSKISVPVGERVYEAIDYLIIGYIYKGGLYFNRLSDMRNNVKYTSKKSSGYNGNSQTKDYYPVEDLIPRCCDYIPLTSELYDLYEKGSSLYHIYSEKYYFEDKYNKYHNPRDYEDYRNQLVEIINKCNEYYNQDLAKRFTDSKANEIQSDLEDIEMLTKPLLCKR